MIHRIVQAALRQRFLVLMLTGFITVGGILSFQRMPVDAYPDLAPPQVELITQWPGPRRRRSRAAGYAAARTSNERRAAHDHDAVDFTVWALRYTPDF